MTRRTVIAPGSCGELVQGTINGQHFLITCPISCYAAVTVELTDDAAIQDMDDHPKTRLAVIETLRYFRRAEQNFRIEVCSALPVGKGMASSSADISGACLATAACLGENISPEQIAAIALSIEPTDAVFFSGIVMFDHRSGQICQYIGESPALEVLVFDVGGQIDTVFFNARPDLADKNRCKEHIVKEAVALIRKGINTGNTGLIGQAATMSALANQSILLKHHLEQVVQMSLQAGALGVNVAHSGTVVGVLLDPQSTVDRSSLIADICRHCAPWRFLQSARLTGGGLRLIPGKERKR